MQWKPYESSAPLTARSPAAPYLVLDLNAEMAAQQEARELIASMGDVPCVEAGRAADGGGIWVYPNELLADHDESLDPYGRNHFCGTWVEALERIKTYITLFNAGPVDTSK